MHIHMYGPPVDDIRAALRTPANNPNKQGPWFDAAETIAKYVIYGAGGNSFTLEPPL